MKFENRDTKMFMELVRDLVAARYTYLLHINEYYKVDPGKTLLGYRYINSVMDAVRQVLSDGKEIEIGGFGKFTVVTELNGDRTVVFCSGKSLRQAVRAGEGRV